MINMSSYKLIYKDRVHNCLSIIPITGWDEDKHQSVVNSLEVMVLNEDNKVEFIKDEVSEFQFIRK